MGQLVSIIKELFNLVVTLVEFLFSLIADLVEVIALLGKSAVDLPNYFGYLFPQAFVSLFVTVFGIVIVYKILGREG